jgi:hypothetical protein
LKFNFTVNTEAIAALLNQTAENIFPRLKQEIQILSLSAHQFIVRKAQLELNEFDLEKFLGDNGKNVRWQKVADSIWVVEIDESARQIEEGRERRFMGWLLDNNPKARTRADGTKYAVIPFKNQQFVGPGKKEANEKGNQAIAALIRNEMSKQKISLTRIERNPDGTPKLGVLHRIEPALPGPQTQFPSLYSMPRTPEMAMRSGLPIHGGIPLTAGTAIIQRMQGKKPIREAVTFRIIDSRHESEGRWFQKAKPGLNSLKAAYDNANRQWEAVVKALQAEFGG